MRARKVIAACGVLAVLAVAACGSGGPGAAAGSAATPVAVSPPPSWAAALGSHITIFAPPTAGPAADTPAAAVAGYVHQLAAPNPAGACLYWIPTSQADCQSDMSDTTEVSISYSSFRIGYTAVYSDVALVVLMFTHLCQAKSCVPDNTNPAALLDSGKSFDDLWTLAMKPGGANSELLPCIQGDGVWYIDLTE